MHFYKTLEQLIMSNIFYTIECNKNKRLHNKFC